MTKFKLEYTDNTTFQADEDVYLELEFFGYEVEDGFVKIVPRDDFIDVCRNKLNELNVPYQEEEI